MPDTGGLYWEEHGPADGPPVVLSPGLGGTAAYWTSNLAALAERHRVILYDHRGTGRSDRALPAGLDVEDMADDVLALLDGLDIARASLVGHAAGGVIGLSLALRHPERLASLVLVNAFARPDPHFVRCMETRLALLEHSGVVAFVRAQPLFLYPARWISEHWDRLQAAEAEYIAQFQGAANVEARIGALAAFDIEDRLGEIETPVLLISAEDDMLVPDLCSEQLERGLPHARLERMRGGHACNVTEPDSFNRHLLEFLGD
ncbi:MAG TPA: pyrimidine utilization protein D [Allosphingosinicella sp.]|nr:pyrimidine utilization protein D [Allosphingosinicella sp.]